MVWPLNAATMVMDTTTIARNAPTSLNRNETGRKRFTLALSVRDPPEKHRPLRRTRQKWTRFGGP